MARTAITPQTPTVAGAAVTYEPANVDGNSVDLATGPKLLHVKNGSGASITVTLPTPGTVAGLAIADRTVAVPAGGERLIRLDRVVRQTNGTAHVDYSAVTTVTVAALNA